MPKKPPPVTLAIDHDADAEVGVRRGFRGRREINVMFRRPGADFTQGLTITLSDEDAERLRGELERTMRT